MKGISTIVYTTQTREGIDLSLLYPAFFSDYKVWSTFLLYFKQYATSGTLYSLNQFQKK
jgi:hypothetical protein